MENIRKRSQAHFQGCYQILKNEIVFKKMLSKK